MFFVGQNLIAQETKQDPPNPAPNRPAGPESSGNELRETHMTWLPAGGTFTTDVSLLWSWGLWPWVSSFVKHVESREVKEP